MPELNDLLARLGDDLGRRGIGDGLPGVSVAIGYRGRTCDATFGVVNSRTGVQVTPDSLFQIQSITKICTATLVMQLVDDGLVTLDVPVRNYLPEFHTSDPAASERITIRHLLIHTGGFEGDLWAPTTSGADALDRFVRDLVSGASQHSPPGERFSYCSAGFGTLGRIVEVLRGATYEEVFRDRLADPLGIDEIAFSADQALAFRTAIGHVRPGDGFPLRPTRHWAVMPPSNPAAGNQLAMSARALLAVGRLFVSAGRAADGSQILSAASVELMLQPQFEHPGGFPEPIRQGLGWWLTRPGFAEHTGGSIGIASILRVAPEHGLTAVVLTNADAGARLMTQLLDPLFTDLTGVPPKPDVIPPPPAVRAPRPERFVGRYATRQRHSVVAQDDDGRLWLTSRPRKESETMASLAGVPTSTDLYELRHLHDESFVRVGADERARGTVTFTDPDAGGRFRFLMADRAAPRLE